jgi:hypothetical protein
MADDCGDAAIAERLDQSQGISGHRQQAERSKTNIIAIFAAPGAAVPPLIGGNDVIARRS